MAIFTRRKLQRMLDANSTFLTPQQTQHHVRALNLDRQDAVNALAAEWEVVLLHALSLFGQVEHEVGFGGTSHPDLYFCAPNDDLILETLAGVDASVARQMEWFNRWLAGEEIEENLGTYQERCQRCEWENTPYTQELKKLHESGLLEEFVEKNPFSFVADIAMVTDEGLHDRNPIEAFSKELWRLLRKHQIKSGIYYQVGSFSDREAAATGRKLKLPSRGRLLSSIFGTKAFKEFLQQVKSRPDQQRQVEFNEPGVEVTFTYDPRSQGLGGSHASFRGVSRHAPNLKAPPLSFNQYDWKSNSLYRALQNKSDQLKKSGAKCRRGIFLCDGGSQLVHDKGTMNTRTAPEVIRNFLLESSSVDFVVLISIDWGEKPRPATGIFTSRLLGTPIRDRVPQLMLWCEANPRILSNFEGRYFAASLVSLCLATRLRLPDPIATPENALHWLRSPQKHEGRSGLSFSISGFPMNPQSVSFSSRALLELLAGKIELSELLRRYGMAPTGDPHLDSLRQPSENPFEAALKQGKSISFADLTTVENDDDNLITFKFEPDSAISPFAAPTSEPPNRIDDETK